MPLPVFDNAAYLALLAQRRANDASILGQQGAINSAQLGALGGDADLLAARRAALAARRTTIGAQGAVTAASRGVNAAQGGVLNAETTQLAGTRGLIGLQQQQSGARAQDLSLIRSARGNLADKSAVAQEGLAQGVEDQRLYGRFGVAAPVSVDVPAGATTGALGLGTRASLRTQEEVVRGQVADREADRSAQLENARLAVSMSATNVTEAELLARRAGLSLADARLMVESSQNAEAAAGADVTGAQLNNSQTDIELQRLGINLKASELGQQGNTLSINNMKAPGDEGFQLYTDPNTMQKSWKTPAEADQAQHDYEVSLTRARLPESVSLTAAHREALRQAESQGNPMMYFDDSDFVWYLAQGNLDPKSRDPWEPDRTVAVVQGLRAKYPGAGPDVINTKLLQYVNAAKTLRAKQQDEAAQAAAEEAARNQPRKPKTSARP